MDGAYWYCQIAQYSAYTKALLEISHGKPVKTVRVNSDRRFCRF
jgi:hypothetical protein